MEKSPHTVPGDHDAEEDGLQQKNSIRWAISGFPKSEPETEVTLGGDPRELEQRAAWGGMDGGRGAGKANWKVCY